MRTLGIEMPSDQVSERIEHSSIKSSLFWLSLPLVARGIVLAGIHYFYKRRLLSQKGIALAAAYTDMSMIESFIFILIFHSLHIISAKAGGLNDSKKDPKKIGELYRQGVLFGFILMIPTVILSLSAEFIFKWMRQPDIVISNSRHYFSVGIFAYFFDMLFRTQIRIAIGVGNSVAALVGEGVESIVDVVVTDALVNGKYGLPEMGICSASWGYLIGAIGALISSSLCLYYKNIYAKYDFFNFEQQTDWVELKDTMKGGLQMAASSFFNELSQMLMTAVCGLSGQNALVALQEANTFNYLEALPGEGIQEAAAAMIGKFHEKDAEAFHKLSSLAITTTVGISWLFALLAIFKTNWVAESLISLDTVQQADLEMIKSFLRAQACMGVINSAPGSYASLLSGCKETRYPLLLCIAYIFILNSVLVAASYFGFNASPVTAFEIQLVGMFFYAGSVGLRWKKELNKASLWVTENRAPTEVKPAMQLESPRRLEPMEMLTI